MYFFVFFHKSSNFSFFKIYSLFIKGTASGELYFDDGLTFEYKKNAEFIYRGFVFNRNTLKSM